MAAVYYREVLVIVKYEFSFKNCTVPFKEVLVKKDFVLDFDQKAFFKEKIIFCF